MHLEPVHVLYAGAHLIKPGLLDKMKSIAINALRQSEPAAERVAQRLEHAAIEDLRIDFEDGFGTRSPEEEDAAALTAGQFAADAGGLPPFWGIRIKSLAPSTRHRALQTLTFFTSTGAIPPVVTLPKITARAEVQELAHWLDAHRLTTRIELMVETVYAVQHLPELIDACAGRCDSLHFGAYDFLSELGVAWPDQTLQHPFCDQARYQMQLAASAAGVRVVDGVTSLLPIGDRPREGWDAHIRNVRHSLSQGFYASWDVHPAQVAARYVALFQYFTQHKQALAERLANFRERQRQATRVGAAFDDAATVRGLERFFERGVQCGAIAPDEA